MLYLSKLDIFLQTTLPLSENFITLLINRHNNTGDQGNLANVWTVSTVRPENVWTVRPYTTCGSARSVRSVLTVRSVHYHS